MVSRRLPAKHRPSTGTFVGIDGIPGGWVAVYLGGDGSLRFAHAEHAADLLSASYERAMIDMPVGLPQRGYRQCDVEARALAGSRVFLGARAGVWTFKTLEEANAHYWQAEGASRGISIQLFGIRQKLQEINQPPVLPRLFEAHPELIFRRLAGCLLPSKKSPVGREQRIAILEAHGIGAVRQWLEQRRGTGIGRDDLIDACACALAARDSTQWLPRRHRSGDPRIWY